MNILLVTTIYPSMDLELLNSTSVCHYFAKEWVRQGHNVKVVFNYPIYHPILHKIAKVFESKIASMGSAFVTTRRIVNDCRYELDGVIVDRFPLYKKFPRSRVSKIEIDKQIDKIIDSNDKDGFKPDVVTAHFVYPHIEMVCKLKSKYKVPVALIVHQQRLKLKTYYPNSYQQLLESIDVWGFRSPSLKKDFETKYGSVSKAFICQSGIPKTYLEDLSSGKSFQGELKRFLFVGSLIKRKYPDSIIYALDEVYKNNDYEMHFVGDGSLRPKLEKMAANNSRIKFDGRLKRDEVQDLMADAECFIMISKDETFGLVYIEAMAKGCIVIASKDEGMEGIIEDGVNGFLCEAGNHKNLIEIVKKINVLSINEKSMISKNAIKKALMLTDEIVAENYLNRISIGNV